MYRNFIDLPEVRSFSKTSTTSMISILVFGGPRPTETKQLINVFYVHFQFKAHLHRLEAKVNSEQYSLPLTLWVNTNHSQYPHHPGPDLGGGGVGSPGQGNPFPCTPPPRTSLSWEGGGKVPQKGLMSSNYFLKNSSLLYLFLNERIVQNI